MLKILLISFVLFALSFHAVCQTLEDESTQDLLGKISRSEPDTIKVQLLLALSKKLVLRSGANKSDIDSAIILLNQAEKLSTNLGNIKSQGRCLLIASLIANKKGKNDIGLTLSQKALSLFTKIKDFKGVADAYIIIGQHYGNTESALEQKIFYYKKAIDVFLKLKEKERAATTLIDLADLQQQQGKVDEPLANLNAALSIYQSIGYKKLQGLYSLMGDNYTFQGDVVNGLKYGLLAVETAEEQQDKTLQLCTIYNRVAITYFNFQNYTRAYQYLKLAFTIARKYQDENYIDVVGRNMAQALYYMKRYSEALSLLKSMASMGFYKQPERRINLFYGFLYIYLGFGDYQMAKVYANELEALLFSKANVKPGGQVGFILIKYYVETHQYRRSYPLIKEYYNQSKQENFWLGMSRSQLLWFKADSGLSKYYSAIKHHQLYKTFADSNFNEQRNKQTSLLQVQFETQKKNNALLLQMKNIDLLKKQSQLRQIQFQQAQLSRNWTIIGSLLLLLLLGLVYSRYRLKERNNVQLQIKQSEIQFQNKLLENLVIEKDWLLKEVHHRVKNNLQIVMSLLNTQSAYLKNLDALEAIRESQNRVQTISLIHQKLYSGSNVASIDMAAYVSDLIKYLGDVFNVNSRRIRFEQLVDAMEIDLAQAVPIGLILNEAITNAIKYAFSKVGGKIIVALQSIGNNSVVLTVSDNGKGLPKDFDAKLASSLGMEIMKALSKQLDGNFQIKSELGATVTIVFQLQNVLSANTVSRFP
ncbi:histidine kinase dimerization/phosphoacceptor domain -containing protein [Mucilaginibacter sp.]|uniref:histidine kinase dimerization/phosphoacceptor domain -containing protein n=1 Tax=Mucilaginibacter sp. TaxID=1882438 RepID=UPI0025E4FFE0|nr:histidine kinase dimerization/phosphoacceptor domain -containing protein [Mucilaginibacter sp.]